MPRFTPFRGLRYDSTRADLAAVTAPPYDVIDDEERATLVSGAADNIVRIDLPVAEERVDPYEVAPALLGQWSRDGLLVRDDDPAFYVYRLDYIDDVGAPAHTLGVLGALTLERPGEGGILPHEHTTPKAKSDRLRMLQVCEANLSAVWGLSPASGLSDLLQSDDVPAVDFEDADGIRHRLWLIVEPGRIAAISSAVASEPVVIADGHHRYETSLQYRDERRDSDGPGPWDETLMWIVELAPDQLGVRPIHRLLSALPDGTDVVGALGAYFEVGEPEDASAADDRTVPRLVAEGALAVVVGTELRLLHPRPGAFDGVRSLDTSWVEAATSALPPHEVTYQHGVENIVRRVAKGDAQAGLLLRPASVAQILDIAHGGERMPPKTTFFHPKPRTGLVIRVLDE